MNGIKRNIWLLYLYTFCSGLYFDRALWMLYLVERGLNLAEVGVLESLLHIAIVFFEVPTGILADLFGRKRSLMIGSVLGVSYAFFMMIGDHFFLFSLAFALHGLGITFTSGARQALFYDSLKATGREGLYTKVMGNEFALLLIGMSLAKWAGGYLAEEDWNIVYLCTIVGVSLSLVPLLFVKEPPRESPTAEAEKKPLGVLWRQQFANSFSVWKQERSLRLPILLNVLLASAMTIVIFYAQEYFARLGFSPSEIGLIMTIESLVGIVAAKSAFLVDRKLSLRTILFGIYFLIAALIVALSLFNGWAAAGALFLLGFLSVLFEPIYENFIHGKITSDIRATFFSMISVLISFSIAVTFPLFGLVVDWIGFQASFWLISGLLAVLGIVMFTRRQSAL